jgi:4-amino-4-deoxy-L-arabinose transferase-like glycosyltransferase
LNTPLLPSITYKFLFTLLGLVYIAGLFVPLMDNDSAHHADIALRMHLTGDYVNLIDYGKDYLDKPHLHFWLCAFSYKLFGVTSFAYKFPSFLFTILGTYSTYRLGKALYDNETGKLAALITGSAFAYILANNDVRMDAILTASIAFATWQLVAFIQNKKLLNAAGAALGLALGFCTKGHIAVFVPAIGALCYILYLKEWKIFLNWKWLALLVLFGLFITPVVYCYYLQYNLHPEKIVRGKDHVNGVQFILFGQSVERFQGDSFGGDSKNDYFFFLHSFLWAFAPWCILAYIGIAGRLRHLLNRKEEWLTPGIFIIVLLVVSFSGFKLPHYLNIVFPSTAVLTAAFIMAKRTDTKWIKPIFTIQLIASILLLVLIAVITFWAFPIRRMWVIIGVIALLSVFFYFIKSKTLDRLQRAISFSVATMILCFFLLNTNFYPQLLKYQGGNELAFASKGKVDPRNVFAWKETYSSSFNFYTKTLRQQFTDSTIDNRPGEQTWLLYDIRSEEDIKAAGYTIGEKLEAIDYEITKLDIKFVNPASRESQCTKLVLANITPNPFLEFKF